MTRANYIRAPHFFNLDQACGTLREAFGPHIYLVGSSLSRRDHGDVDVRCILPDEHYDRLFPGLCASAAPHRSALWSLVCASISLWLSRHADLPVDFQIQQATQANEQYPTEPRSALGLFLAQR